MRSQSVLTLCFLFWLSFGVVWKAANAYDIQEDDGDYDSIAEIQKGRGEIIPSKTTENVVQTLRFKRSKSQVDSSAIVFPKDDGYPKCEDTHTCSTLDNCQPFSKENPICGWNGTLPLVCCLKKQTKIPLDKGIISESECSRRIGKKDFFDKVGFVMGGKDVESITKWPFMVSIFQWVGKNLTFICGGSLISRKHVLTAAHCFVNREGEYDVISGLLNLKSFENGSEPFTIHPVTNIHVHPNFKFPQLHDDIAILTIPSIEVFSPTTRPVCLPLELLENGDTEKGTILGWGKTQIEDTPSDVLQVAHMYFVNRSTCEKTFKESDTFFTRSFPRGISPRIVCAGNKHFPKDVCKSDSGGPLVVIGEDKIYRLVGVVSYRLECGEVGIPGIYTGVDQYFDWIEATVAINQRP